MRRDSKAPEGEPVFRDDGVGIYSMTDTFLVVCPRCQSCAEVTRHGPLCRLVCPQCSLTRAQSGDTMSIYSGHGPAVDAVFGLPLWLQAPCCGNLLWAFNLRHLDFIERYVRASLRERRRDENGWANSALGSRLPGWIVSAKNRDEILKTAAKLKEQRDRPPGA
jgi:hypothetical protein